MKTQMVAAAVSLMLGAGGGLGFAWVRRPPPAPPAELAADSTAASAAGATSTHADSLLQEIAPQVHAIPEDSAAAVADTAGLNVPVAAPPSVSSSTAAHDSAATADETARLSQIFGTMKPAEAARVLAQLEDRLIEVLLMGLPDRKAAAILSNLPAERAAALTRSIMSRKGE